MIPLGFIDWASPLQPEAQDAIVVCRLDAAGSHAIARGVARELAAAYGQNILAWRRDAALPGLPGDGGWRRFPDEVPVHAQPVETLFLDAIGWRALSLRGMSSRYYERPSRATCVYHAGLPFGAMVARKTLAGFPDCSDRLRWAAYGWREAGEASLADS